MILKFELWMTFSNIIIHMKAAEQYFSVVLFVFSILYKTENLLDTVLKWNRFRVVT